MINFFVGAIALWPVYLVADGFVRGAKRTR
jgi:hypothetical protein